MKRWFRAFFTPPQFKEHQKTFAARLLHPILLSTIFIYAPALPILFLIAPGDILRNVVGALASLSTSFGLIWLERRGRVPLASTILVTLLWLMLTAFVFTGSGIRAPSFMIGYLPVIMIASLLLGTKTSALLAAASILVGLILLQLEQRGLWRPTPELSVEGVWALAAFIFCAMVMIQSLSARIRQEAMDKAQQELEERRRAEEKVQQLNAQLELRVQERTAELEAANQELSAFTYSVSHDLRAPLRSIDGYSYLLREENQDKITPESQGYLERIRENAQKMGELIDGLLDFSHLGKQPLKKQVVQMDVLVYQAMNELASEMDPERVEVTMGELPDCEADPVLARTVLVNLLSNAIKYSRMRNPSRVEIGWQDGAYFVRDNGVGFDMRYANQLFSPFQRLHPVAEYPGHGIGLAMVQRIIQRHGGQIWVEAEEEKGATFFFTLPK